MITDTELVMSDAQAVTVTAPSTSYIDQKAAGDPGKPCYLVIRVDTSFTATGSGTLTIDLETDDNTAFSSATILWSSGAVGKASLVGSSVGYRKIIPIPIGAERYLRINYTVATGPMTAGNIDAFITKGPEIA